MDRTKLLDRVAASGDERLMLAKILDKWEQAQRRNIPSATDFLSPQQRAAAESLLATAGVGKDRWVAAGGYPGAQRQVLLFLPDWMAPENADFPFCYLRARYRSEYGLTHRDFLGSLMGLGIVREKVGDILAGEECCDLIVLDSVAEFLLQNWDSAGRARLDVTKIGGEEVQAPPAKCEEVRDTVQTLRLDAVASTGFRLSRSKAAALIEGGKVEVNWRLCVKPDHLLAAGDTVSARGYGKFELSEVGGVTRKGRTGILVKRYL